MTSPNAAAVEGVERKKRALRHYSAEAAVALRIEQLEAGLEETMWRLSNVLALIPPSNADLRAQIETSMAIGRAALAKAAT